MVHFSALILGPRAIFNIYFFGMILRFANLNSVEHASKLILAALTLSLAACQPLSNSTISEPTTELPEQTSTNDKNLNAEASATIAQNAVEPQAEIQQSQAEPTPVEIDLWQRTRDGFQLDLSRSNSRINAQLRYYATHQKYLDRVADRANRYLFYIVSELEKRDMPTELALLPIVESAFDPFAYSHGRASGIWQFIPSTGRHFNLKQNWWYDGRRDIVASTDAALTYLQQLHKRFDDWELALAAYNSGGGTVSKAMRRNRNAGKPEDFWSLNLPKETRAYVPKLIALSKLVLDPAKHNATLKTIPNKPHFQIVEIEGQLDIAQASKMSGMDIDDLYQLNPGFNQWATDPDGPHHLLIPVDKADAFSVQLAQLDPQQRIQWQRYKVSSGDSLNRIAKKHNSTVELLKEINHLRGNMIRLGQVLLIPRPSQNLANYSLSAEQRTLARQQRGASGKYRIAHTVKSGDSFWTISRKHKVTVRQLASWNNMAPGDPLVVGKRLVIWTSGGSRSATGSSPGVIRKVTYRVRNGDSLSRIANRFNVGVSQIKSWNTLDAKYLQPGQTLTLFVDVTKGTR